MNLIDTHAHIYLNDFADDRPAILDRAKQTGIEKILMPAIDSATHPAMLELETENPGFCISMMGLHPCSVNENFLEELAKVEQYLTEQRFVAIGEIGLDFYWDVSFKEQQYIAFRRQIELAIDYGLPIAIHSRNSTDECIQVVKEYKNSQLKGVFHCFSGSSEQAIQIIELGFYLGIGGVLTFKNAGLDKVTMDISVDHILLETDAPYLAPVPFRGKRNECSYISYTAQKLADLKETTVENIAKLTSSNAQKLFGL
ncbi:TatD family hydrolase [Terrimonas pollutisoli]|uniref:TatD family hydrolase n=1 Tax=Terrimonas pollutisoli TaxID=3034147 RepID=UPI0023EC51D2|nr:TatD family hydrolase [Terrimonas sp. H1YJ31]